MRRREPWVEAVARAVKAIPRGSTATYAQVALFAGRPGGARSVARALQAAAGLPWWRVIRSDRTLAAPVRVEQARRLAREGVRVEGGRVVRPPPPPRAPAPRMAPARQRT